MAIEVYFCFLSLNIQHPARKKTTGSEIMLQNLSATILSIPHNLSSTFISDSVSQGSWNEPSINSPLIAGGAKSASLMAKRKQRTASHVSRSMFGDC